MKNFLFTDRRKIFDFEKAINSLPKKSAVIIREYDLEKASRESFARKISTLARAKNLQVLVGKDFNLAKKIKADGVHFSDFDKLPLQIFKKKSFPKNFIFSFSCHSFKSFLRLRKLAPNFVFIAPVFATSSHVDAKRFGLLNLAKISVQKKKQNYFSPPIYALGGVNKQNLRAIKKLKISGFGAIDYFLNL